TGLAFTRKTATATIVTRVVAVIAATSAFFRIIISSSYTKRPATTRTRAPARRSTHANLRLAPPSEDGLTMRALQTIPCARPGQSMGHNLVRQGTIWRTRGDCTAGTCSWRPGDTW